MSTTIIGFPRLGEFRELKFTTEKYFRNEITADELLAAAKDLRAKHWNIVKEKGIRYVYPVSVIANEGLKPVLSKAWELIQEIPREELEEVHSVEELIQENNKKDDWIVKKTSDNVFEVDGRIVAKKTMIPHVMANPYAVKSSLKITENLSLKIPITPPKISRYSLRLHLKSEK